MLIILLGCFTCPIIIHSATVAIPAISAELSLSAHAGSWISFLPIMGGVLLVLPAGKLADIYGRRRTFCAGIAMSSLSCVIAALSVDQLMLFVARFLMGTSMSFVWAPALALVSSIPKPEHKVRAIGIFAAVGYLGIVSGPIVGGIIIDHLHWRWTFWIPSAVLAPIALVGFKALNWERYGDRSMKLNISDLALNFLSIGLIGGSVLSTNAVVTLLMLGSGLLFFGFFCWHQSRQEDPLLQTRLFTESRMFTAVSTSHLLYYFSIFAFPLTLTMYLSYIKGLDGSTIGSIIMAQAMGTSCISFINNWLSKFFNLKVFLGLGLAMVLAGTVVMTQVDADTPKLFIIGLLLIAGAGVGIMDPQIVHLATTSVKESLLGSASAVLSGMRTLGGFLSLGFVSMLMDIHVRGEVTDDKLPELATALMQYYLVGSAALIATAVLMVIIIFPEISKQQDKTTET